MTEGHRASGGWRFPPERRHALWDEDRQKRLPPEPVLAAAIEPGMTVVDVGAGTGFWVPPLSTAMGPGGRVIAADVEPLMVTDLRTLIHERGLTNVEAVQSDEYHVPVADRTADAALLAFVLHEPPDPAALVREISRLLKPVGRVLVLEWQKRETEIGPPVEHRLSSEETRSLLAAEGYRVEPIASPHDDLYVLLGTR